MPAPGAAGRMRPRPRARLFSGTATSTAPGAKGQADTDFQAIDGDLGDIVSVMDGPAALGGLYPRRGTRAERRGGLCLSHGDGGLRGSTPSTYVYRGLFLQELVIPVITLRLEPERKPAVTSLLRRSGHAGTRAARWRTGHLATAGVGRQAPHQSHREGACALTRHSSRGDRRVT